MFTLEEYIEKNQLGVSPKDWNARKMIMSHLRSRGYRQTRCRRNGKFVTVWVDGKGYAELEQKLKELPI